MVLIQNSSWLAWCTSWGSIVYKKDKWINESMNYLLVCTLASLSLSILLSGWFFYTYLDGVFSRSFPSLSSSIMMFQIFFPYNFFDFIVWSFIMRLYFPFGAYRSFIYCNIYTFNNFMKCFIVTCVVVASRGVFEKNSFICPWFKFAKLIIIYFDITYTSKVIEILHRFRSTIPNIICRFVIVNPHMSFVEYVDYCLISFPQNVRGTPDSSSITRQFFLNNYIHSFSNFFLLRIFGYRELSFDAIFITNNKESIWYEFIPSIKFETFYF